MRYKHRPIEGDGVKRAFFSDGSFLLLDMPIATCFLFFPHDDAPELYSSCIGSVVGSYGNQNQIISL